MTVSIGELRERIRIDTPSAITRDSIGGIVEGWTVLATVWAKVAPMSAGEQYRRQQIQASASWRVTIRYRSDVKAQNRVVWQGRTFEVKGVTSPDLHKRFLELACEELQAA
jgi:SPP1 family predicted phage head-tail adaptor